MNNIFRTISAFMENLLFPSPLLVILLSILIWYFLHSKKNKLIHYLLFFIILTHFGLGNSYLINYALKKLETYHPALPKDLSYENPIIIVLSAGWVRFDGKNYNIYLGEAGWERLAYAAELWKKYQGDIILSGDIFPHSVDSVAESMRKVAINMGIPDNYIYLENQASNTYENILYSLPIITKLRSTDQKRPVILVTSASHMLRSEAIARKLGLNAIPAPCHFTFHSTNDVKYIFPSIRALKKARVLYHEILGTIGYRILGRL